jgi:hypothetical protein
VRAAVDVKLEQKDNKATVFVVDGPDKKEERRGARLGRRADARLVLTAARRAPS